MPWLMGVVAGGVSTFLDSFASAVSFFTLGKQCPLNDGYWSLIAFATAMGGSIFCIGSMRGMALLRAERVRLGWYFSHVGWKALVGAAIGLVLMLII